jgi:hypothetical protein
MRKIKELKEWLSQFNDNDGVYGYEGEIQGIVVVHKEKYFSFHNDKDCSTLAPLLYPQFPKIDDNL